MFERELKRGDKIKANGCDFVVLDVRGNRVRIGVDAPRDVKITFEKSGGKLVDTIDPAIPAVVK